MTRTTALALAFSLAIVGAARPLPAQSSSQTIEQTLPRVVKIFGAGGLAEGEGS